MQPVSHLLVSLSFKLTANPRKQTMYLRSSLLLFVALTYVTLPAEARIRSSEEKRRKNLSIMRFLGSDNGDLSFIKRTLSEEVDTSSNRILSKKNTSTKKGLSDCGPPIDPCPYGLKTGDSCKKELYCYAATTTCCGDKVPSKV
jgi:hypothetical protein